jgi:phosphonoacetate hydrolase
VLRVVTQSVLADVRARALDVLLDPGLSPVVDLVAWRDGEVCTVAAARGRVSFTAAAPHHTVAVEGDDPVAAQDPLAPDDAPAQYPFARERVADLFRDANAPDLAVVHTGAHHWPERGGHLGEHGSLNHRQSRAPLLVAGAGVRDRGLLDRTARMTDAAALLRHACGAGDGLPDRVTGLVEPGARLVVGLLWDGANAHDLYALAEAGELPGVARMLETGCAYRGGSVAEWPSVTLTNHTSAITGVGPGTHGILNNAFWDRERRCSVVPNDSSTWHIACDSLRPGVQTVFESVRGATAAVNEPVDRGAGYSTFDLVRAQHTGDGARGMTGLLPDATTDPHASQSFVAANVEYASSTRVDALGWAQVSALLADPATVPRLLWWNSILPDTAHHEGGPRSEISRAGLRDSDRRLQALLDRLDALGLTEDTTVVLTSDHGSEAADPACRGDWLGALTAAGVHHHDEAYSFLYL